MMRIKWNRHLDGGSSRRPEDEAGTQEADEKKRGASSSPSIFKIFRRKKSRRRDEDESKNTVNNGRVPPLHLEADEDDSASITSIATCASQPVTEGFQRDRSSSLFSSFRLSLPGSKRKKRKVAPTPTETLLNGQDNEPQLERYSTPDLRKNSDKLVAPKTIQTNLSTSSPSIRNPKGSSTSAQSLDCQNSESMDKLKWSKIKSTTSGSKLSKSVSFSECGDTLIDSSHSKRDNKTLRAVNSAAMVEEDSEALERELPSCMSDKLRMSRESKFTVVDDVLTSVVCASNPQKQSSSEAAGAEVMTKSETPRSKNFNLIEERNISDSDNIFTSIATEIPSSDKSKNDDRICDKNSSAVKNVIASSVTRASVNYHNGNELLPMHVDEENNYDREKMCLNLEKCEMQLIEPETDVSTTSEWNSCLKSSDSRNDNIILRSKINKNIHQQTNSDTSSNTGSTLNKKLEVLASELSILTVTKNLSSLKSHDSISNKFTGDDLPKREQCNYQTIRPDSSLSVKEVPVTNSKHVLCHMRVFENELLMQKLEGSQVVHDQPLKFEKPINKIFPENLTINNVSVKESSDKYILNQSKISETHSSPSKCDIHPDEPSALNLCCEIKIDCDQKVPDSELIAQPDLLTQCDQKVPEFELSLLEFEEVCNKYMSRSNPELSDSNSSISLYRSSPKPKSVLDLNFPFIYPNFLENGDGGIPLRNADSSCMSFSHNDLLMQSTKINNQNSCRISTEKNLLPSLPKQWINYDKSIDSDSNCNVCPNGVQCTKVRGKNLCQELCLGVLPTVMPADSDLGGIDTPQLSTTLPNYESKSGREHSSVVTSEKKHLSNDQTSKEDMISNTGVTISALNEVLDYSYASESPGKTSVYLDPEIRDTYRGPRAICDPLVYEVAKRLESLGSENYLRGHNFCDRRNVGFCDVISDVSRDCVEAGNGLIEISNPYEEDTFLLPHDLSNRNFISDVSVTLSNFGVNGTTGKNDHISCDNLEFPMDTVDENFNSETSKVKVILSKITDESKSEKQISTDNLETDFQLKKLKQPSLNGIDNYNEQNMTHVEQKNVINKVKNSMIPCRTKSPSDIENKRIEMKAKSKKSNSLPKFIKSESQLPVKSNSSHRMLFNLHKDSGAGHNLRGKQKDSSNNKPNQKCSNNSTVNSKCVNSETSDLILNSRNGNTIMSEDFDNFVSESNNTQSVYFTSALESSIYSNSLTNFENNNCNSLTGLDIVDIHHQEAFDDSKNILSSISSDNIPLQFKTQESVVNSSLDNIKNADNIISKRAIPFNENHAKPVEEFCPLCLHSDEQEHIDGFTEHVKYRYCSKHLDTAVESPRRLSLPAIELRKTSFTSSKESLSSQLTSSSNKGKSRIPTILSKIKRSVSGTFTAKRNRTPPEQSGTRGAPSSKGPVRPPMWLSKAELTQEIQRLGTLCEARTKELNRLKMETKHVSSGFDAFASLFKYMVEDLNSLSVPALTEDLKKTLKQLELTKQDLAYYEREVEEMKSHHCQELNDLSNKLFEVYQSEMEELNAKHQEEINHLKGDHQNQIEHLTTTFDESSAEVKTHHEKMIATLEQEIVNQREELREFQEREIKDLEEKHAESSKLVQDHIEQMQKKYTELKQHAMSMEDAMKKDADSKLQWVTTAKLDLEKEVESLKAVLEMKNKELHTLRVQNLEMEKQLEELPFLKEKIKMLQARAEDLEALMAEKTKLERKLCSENQEIKDTYEKETKINRRLSMENEELQWRLRQAENSLISGSFCDVPEYQEVEENAASSPTKSPGPQILSRSVFFTFADKDECSPHSPRSQYKKITPHFSANYKTSPAKSSKSPPAPSPRRGKSHSEPPQPITTTNTPRKVAKQPLNKIKGSQKRQRSGSDSGRLSEHADVNFSSVTDSMASSVSSDSSVFEHRERLLEEHKEQIIHSLEILREQRSTESSVDEPTILEKKWCSDDIKITGELSNLETEDMSRSAEFADPKTYYHMTFPVLKETGIADCDIDDSKNSSSGNSPMKESLPSKIMHSTSENNINSAVQASGSIQVMSISSQEGSSRVIRVESKRNSCTESMLSTENVQRKATDEEKTENRWRTM